ncbi:hypothetical protein [Bacillus haynesii]|uniref:Uncharacterized protein n=1 Tax=Bacillus haynesii TaxID=1925021 RepID=A0AA90EVL2_9BACI|nr:hypothetical protein [Bacillus haynesii]MCY7789381.1 hypothetical protein [Bacillus haynesii]MCY8382534.1 hypothetical protein [Bacillus haynesii]MCY8586983.1 hypothetical protein [Bacillus haynesii]MCY9280170.1 hypothetical protein [Bacillus haynesii]MCY9390183.1 hypothetical protein [Bacillus haynesii]
MKMKETINICYIDDRIDYILDKYLDEYCRKQNEENKYGYQLEFTDYEFELTDNYKTLLSNNLINQANIIVIDSRLFENENSSLSKFTGEQFKIILRQILPFIKTIVISQNDSASDSLTIRKFKSTNSDQSSQEYYNKYLEPALKQNIIATIEEHQILNQLTLENEVDSLLIGTIQNTISGIRDTALFEKEDLDNLIKLFNEVKVNYGD